MIQPLSGDRLSPDKTTPRFSAPTTPHANCRCQSQREHRWPRRIAFAVLLTTGLLALAFGTARGQWTRISFFSTQICLSCMGLI